MCEAASGEFVLDFNWYLREYYAYVKCIDIQT